MPDDLAANAGSEQSRKPHRITLDDRLVAIATTSYASAQPGEIDDGFATRAAIDAGGEFEALIVNRARHLSNAGSIRAAIQSVRHVVGLIVFGGVVLGLLAGAGAAKAALTVARDEPVNFYWALGATLGVQTFFLLLWMALFALAIRHERHGGRDGHLSVATLGGLIWRFARYVASRTNGGIEHSAATAAFGHVHLNHAVGRWTLSSISHGIWLAFNVACLIMLIVMLSARQYTFAWETTVLSERQYVPLTRALAALPQAAGFVTPTAEQIAVSQWPFTAPTSHEVSQAWSGLLIGSIVIYGFAPRLLLLAWSMGRRRRLAAQFRIDVTRPEFVRLQPRLMPSEMHLGVVDAEAGPSSRATHMQRSPDIKPIGLPAILGFELPRSTGDHYWPPAIHGVRWIDLGMVDDRLAQSRVVRTLTESPHEPVTVVVVCALTSTPDRGVGAFLSELASVLHQPLTVILGGGHALRQRMTPIQFAQRLNDWRSLTESVGITSARVIELDIDHLTQASAAKLASIITPDLPAEPEPAQKFDRAFALIIERASNWTRQNMQPSLAEQAELHRDIARVYQHTAHQWRQWLGMPEQLSAQIVPQIAAGASRISSILPLRLKRNGTWLAAGAAAGALGCLAAATLVTPLAISALPMWSVIGGALSGALSLYRDSAKPQNEDAVFDADAMSSAIRAAALFAMLLELQGRDENAITRILDRTTSSTPEPSAMATDNHVRQWLNELSHQFELAMLQEQAR